MCVVKRNIAFSFDRNEQKKGVASVFGEHSEKITSVDRREKARNVPRRRLLSNATLIEVPRSDS